MRRLPAAAVVAGTLGTAALGCTFLASFEDRPGLDGGARDARVLDEPRDAGGVEEEPTADVASPAPDAAPPPDKCDLAFDRAAIKGCAEFEENGQVCGDNPTFTDYPPSDRAKDVITCSKTRGVLCIQHCTGACAHLPSGFPDQCDACENRADKLYCGIEMGWPTKNFHLLVRCTAGRLVQGAAADGGPRNCANGCEPSATGDARCL